MHAELGQFLSFSKKTLKFQIQPPVTSAHNNASTHRPGKP